ncbi:MAG: membrane protein insertase YidC [Firmicutes bacterium]|nr:membrane protein insertase YidC [Bacillota bacterium]
MEFILLQPTNTFILKQLAWLFSYVITLIYNGVVAMTTTNAMGITIILFTLIVRVLLFPLSLKQQRSTRLMQRLQPKIQRIQDKYKNTTDPDSQRMMQMEMNEIYRENKTSPLSGCLPLIIQLPILFALFEILRNLAFYVTGFGSYFDTMTTQVMALPNYQTLITDNFAQVIKGLQKFDVTTFNSVKDLLAHFTTDNWKAFYELAPTIGQNAEFTRLVDLTQQLNSFLGFNLTEGAGLGWPGIIWPVLAGGTTWLQTWLMTKANDKRTIAAGGNPKANQNGMMKGMNYIFPFMTAFFVISMPLGLGLYWVAGNIFSMLQQLLVDKIVDGEEYKQALQHKQELEEKRRLKEVTKSNIDQKTGRRIGTADNAINRSSMAGNKMAAANKRLEQKLEKPAEADSSVIDNPMDVK